MPWSPWLLVCVLACLPIHARAEPPAHTTGAEGAAAEERASSPTRVKQSLIQAKLALERAQFGEADHLLSEVFAQPSLSAQLRNDALELLAIVQIAARREGQAKDTLRLLLRRDPEHPRRVVDPGPAVDAAFARARQVALDTVDVPLSYTLGRDASDRLSLSVELGPEPAEARDAVQGVHVFVHDERGARLAQLINEVSAESPLTFLLPEAAPGAGALLLHVEARAPSGVVLGRIGELDAPVRVALPPRARLAAPCPPPPQKPLRRTWWVWTTVGLVVAGFAVASAVTLQ